MDLSEIKKCKKHKRRNRIIWITATVLCVILLGVSIYLLVQDYYQSQKGKNTYDNLQKEVVYETKPEETVIEEAEPDWTNEVKSVDFKKLWEINPEVYAWIEIPGTAISYPVLQHEGVDDYYLTHTVENEENKVGAIYSEKSSARDFTGFIHILYGHNMKNGTMFAGLHQYEDAEFLKENPHIYISTPDKSYRYKVFAAVVHDDKHLMYNYDFTTAEGRQEYLDDILEDTDSRNQYIEEIEVTSDSKILVLSTCVGGEGDKRYLVNAVLEE